MTSSVTKAYVIVYELSGGALTAVADLRDATDIGYEKRLNELWSARFTYPADGVFASYLTARAYVEIYDGSDRVDLFRIIQPRKRRMKTKLVIDCNCEHVLATLLDDVMFGYNEEGGTGTYTTTVLTNILAEQTATNWTLGTCAFSRQFLYNYENENLLAALFAVPKPFGADYEWTWDTSSYPWTLNLTSPSTDPTALIQYERNMQGVEKHEDAARLITRLYPLGMGEGINQLKVSDIDQSTEGRPEFYTGTTEFTVGETFTGTSSGETCVLSGYYRLSGSWGGGDAAGAMWVTSVSGSFTDGEYLTGSVSGASCCKIRTKFDHLNSANMETYGLVSSVWVDRRYEDDSSLYGSAARMLDEFDQPRIVYSVDVADTYQKHAYNQLNVGDYIKVKDAELDIDVSARVYTLSKPDVIGQPGAVSIDIANRYTDVASSLAELADRQRINTLHAQGATNLDSHDFAENCDENHPLTVRFYIPAECVHINTCSLSYTSQAFRAYSTAIAGGGTTTGAGSGEETTNSGTTGISVQTTAADGSVLSVDEDSNPIVTGAAGVSLSMTGRTSGETDGHTHTYNDYYMDASHGHYATHTHEFSGVYHDHSITDSGHTHTITMSSHTHTIPNHAHDISYGIHEGPTPTTLTVAVDGNAVAGLGTSETAVDITSYLTTGADGKITRGAFHTVAITPTADDAASDTPMGRIEGNLIMQMFVQSRGDTQL